MTTTRALQQRIEAAIDHVFEQWRTGLGDQRPQTAITTAVLAEIAPELDALDALQAVARGYCPACGRGDAAPTVADWEQQKQRADQAEAALARVRRLAAEARAGAAWTANSNNIAGRIDNAIDQPTEH